MTTDQILIVGLLVGMLAVFALDRFRVDTVALSGLALGVLLGLVPPGAAFSGFANPAVVTVVEILLIVQALHRSHLLDPLGAWIRRRFGTPRRSIAALCIAGALLSSVMNNIGALALMLPPAYSIAHGLRIDLRAILMPLSFATLLGGLVTPIGTPANLVVGEALAAARGTGFGFLDFFPTGLAVAAAGLAVILLRAPRLFPPDPVEGSDDDGPARSIVTEVSLDTDTHADALASLVDGAVHTATRDGRRLFPLAGATSLHPGDLLLVTADPAALAAATRAGVLRPVRAAEPGAERAEAAVMPQSTLVGSRVATIEALEDGRVVVTAISTATARLEGGLDDIRLGVGDTLHLAGDGAAIGDLVRDAVLVRLARSTTRAAGARAPSR